MFYKHDLVNFTNQKVKSEICKILLSDVKSNSMEHAINKIALYKKYKVTPILIVGESGAGKEYIAKYILEGINKDEKPSYASYNCSAFTDEMLLSELFGHVKGAFTGAIDNRQGILGKKDVGGIFLDEIDKSSNSFQNALLRYIRNNEYRLLGSNEIQKVESKIIVLATSAPIRAVYKSYFDKIDFIELELANSLEERKNLKKELLESQDYYVEWGKKDDINLSPDFLNRIMSHVISIPPLRFRMNDIGLLVKYFIKELSKELGIKINSISGEALDFIVQYRWPNNVSELEGFIKSGILFNNKGVIYLLGCLQFFESFDAEVLYRTITGNPHTDGVRVYSNGYLQISRNPMYYEGYYNPHFPGLSDYNINPLKIKINKLEKVMSNLLVMNMLDQKEEWVLKEHDLQKMTKYFSLFYKYKTQKEIYTKLGFNSSRPFKNWLKKNHLDH